MGSLPTHRLRVVWGGKVPRGFREQVQKLREVSGLGGKFCEGSGGFMGGLQGGF